MKASKVIADFKALTVKDLGYIYLGMTVQGVELNHMSQIKALKKWVTKHD